MRKVAFLLLPLLLLASQPRFFGYVKFFLHPNLNSPYRLDRFGTRFQLAMSSSLGEKADIYAAFNFNLDENLSTGLATEPRSAVVEIYPVEVYIDLHWEVADLRVGKQLIFWGKTDWINPTDNICPWDYTNITAEIEDYRLPVNAVKLDLYLGDWTLEGVWVPSFKPNRIPMEFPNSIGGMPVQARYVLPDSRPSNWQAGLRLSSYFRGIDFSLSYWYGFDLYPTVRQLFYIPEQPPEFLFEVSYLRQQVFGADFSYAKGRFVLKGEGAYFLTQDREGVDPAVRNPHIYYVLGLDYNFSDRLTMNLQFVQDVKVVEEKFPFVQEPKTTTSASCRIQYKVENLWSFQLITVYNFRDGDFFTLPIFTWYIADGINLYAGAAIFHGPEDSPFGRNKPYSRAFIELKYSF